MREREERRDLTDPVIKTDGNGQPVRASEMGLNRAERRELLQEARRQARRSIRAQRRSA